MPTKSSLAQQCAALATKIHKIKEPLVVDHTEALDPKSGSPIHRFKVVSSASANGPAHVVILNQHGEPLEVTHTLDALFDHNVLSTGSASGQPVAPITIQPDTNILTLNPGQTMDETITVTIPKNAGSA
jgi:hypothetical protein